MSNAWLKFKMWTRVTLFSAASIYVLLFIFKNRNNDIDIDFVFGKSSHNILLVLLLTAIFSIFGWWLLKTVLRAVRQLKEINRRAQLERHEKERVDQQTKAAKLQTRPEHAPPTTSA